ncbi:hypothetical protein [Microbacterium sp. C7(2022)]|uniref:hypothetical protein n=1 Tax=Microbacterium sp. C7(2022) TaxID=2992759 RepID=UPI00237B01CB|nr:hypothetical protein [Microbacterium sp. C7(2022)]MDE0547288.1 hypothetical protein [Microbacterium sp. C7(2022)]
MRWDRFFDDLEDQLASEWEAERAALDTEAERLRLSRVELRDRLTMLTSREATSDPPTFHLCDGTVIQAAATAVGVDWAALDPPGPGEMLVPLASIEGVGMPHADILRSARPAPERSALAERMTFGFVLRGLVRRRVGVAVQLRRGGSPLTGTIDRAGADHLDIALHDAGAPRRSGHVTAFRVIPFSAIAWVRLESPAVI